MIECTSLSNKIVGNVAVSEKGGIMQNDKKIENNVEVCEKIFDLIDKPDNISCVKL